MKFYPILLLTILISQLHAARIKDIVDLVGLRENQVTGMGLVIGLPQTGDQALAAKTALKNILQHHSFKISQIDLAEGNIALVMVTAKLPALATKGTKINITVSAIGDAQSLNGGVLLPTFLKALNNKVYATAQGTISTDISLPTVAKIPNGAIVEKDVPASFVTKDNRIFLRLKNPDFNTADKITQAVNKLFPKSCQAVNLNIVGVKIPKKYLKPNRIAQFIAEIYQLQVAPDIPARIVINERTGSIIAGDNVTISPVVITHNTIRVQVTAQNGKNNVTVEELTSALLAVGANSQDLVVIFRMLKAAGALHAELIII